MQQCSDERISLLAEVLDAATPGSEAVRVLKMYGWAQYLQGRIEEIRRRELRSASLYLGLRAFSSALLYCSPLLSMLAVLTLMHVQDKELSAERVFLIFTTVGLVRAPLGGVAMGFTAVVDGLAAFRRLNAFVSQQAFDLYEKDLQLQEPEAVEKDVSLKAELKGSFVHGHGPRESSFEAFELSADLTLQPGELLAVCGRVASGKSSLLLGLLGELRRVAGRQSLPAGVAYLAQSPWIRSGTVRDVVVQELPFDEKQYWHPELNFLAEALWASRHAIRAAQLGPDLREWPGGDRHAVGARGATLSGGQRTRLGLAHVLYRCLVSEVRVVLLDDCLAAVDPHVARAICEEALLGVLLQGQRSVVMVMNSNFVALRAASRIVNMEQGRASVYNSVDAWIADCSKATREACLQTLADIQARPPSDVGSDCFTEEGDVLECSEQSRRGMLSTKTLTYYFGSGRHSTGVIFLCFIVTSMLSIEGLRIYSDHFMGSWAARDTTNTAEESRSDFQTFCLWVMLAVLGAFLRGWLVVYVALKSSENIHRRLLARLMSAPIGLFDTTPRGRILGHFSKDLDAVDALLPQYLLDFLQDITMLLGIVVVCVWSTPFAAVAVVPVLFGFYKIRHFFSRTAREAKRLDGVTRAPLYSAMGDVADGLATLRAHGQQKSLVQQFQTLLDRNGKVFFQTYILQPWCILVLDSLGSCIVCIASVFCVLLRDSLPASTSTMAISYALMTRGKLQFCIRLSIEAENQLVAAERLAQFEAVIPTEAVEGRPPPEDWPLEGKIFFEHVSMRYRADLPQAPAAPKKEETKPEAPAEGRSKEEYPFIPPGDPAWVIHARYASHEYLYPMSICIAYRLCRKKTGNYNNVAEGKNRSGPDQQGSQTVVDEEDSVLPTQPPDYVMRYAIVRDQGSATCEAADHKEYVQVTYERDGPFYAVADDRRILSSASSPMDVNELADEGGLVGCCCRAATGHREGRVLKGFHLQVSAGRKVSLVGRTGSGKSSLLGALLRVVNLDAGRICIDGVDIANVPLQALRTAVSLIPQEPVLWSGTVAENLDPTKQLSEKRLLEALSKVHFDAKLNGLGGLATRVERSGGNFSLGQRQLLCIARCIARSSRVVLVDEATSCVDGETDALIQDALRIQFQHSTMLVVAHRLQTIMDADLIAVLDAGCVVETGHPAALCADPTSRFSQMAARAPAEAPYLAPFPVLDCEVPAGAGSTNRLPHQELIRSVNAPLYKVTGNWATNGLSARLAKLMLGNGEHTYESVKFAQLRSCAMDDELLATWARLLPEERGKLLRLEDPECVRLIDVGMRMLWTAELQARQFGVRGSTDPLDNAQLPLLATMQFDGFTNQGEKVFKLVKWPKEYHEDPMVLASALRLSLQAGAGNKRRQPAAIKPSRWYQLLSPPAQSWAGFEIQLAQLVEQLILRAREAAEAPSVALPEGREEVWASWDAQKTTCDAVSVAQAHQSDLRMTKGPSTRSLVMGRRDGLWKLAVQTAGGKSEYHWHAVAEQKTREKHFAVKEPRDKDAGCPKDREVTTQTKDMASQTESLRPAVEMIVRITGKWKDESGSRYEVVPDSDSTCTVVTTRPTGRVLRTEGLIQYNAEECCIYWGSKFRLELKDSQSCVWVPLRSGKSFCWEADSPRPVVMHTSTLPTARNIVEASAQLQDLLGISKSSGNSRGALQKRIYNRPLISRSTEEAEEAEEKEEQGQSGGARAAKRARQRERRKLGKVRGCWLAAIVASAGADASDLEFSEVLQEVAKRPPALANVRRAARRHDAVQEQCDLLRVPAQRFRSWAEVAASLKRHERPVIISGLSSLPVLNLDEHLDEDYPINNGQFGPGKAMRSIPLERYLRGNASSFHIFAINRPQHGLHLEPFLLDQARARAAAAVGEGLADLAARWVFSLGLQASSVNRHSHEESWLILFRGRKAWWIGSGTDSFRGWEDPCGALGTAPPPGVEFCVQRPGEVVYIGTHVDHATRNMDPLVLGVGGQGSRADWPPGRQSCARRRCRSPSEATSCR
ncbi:Abcc1 [Symbiodinium microadriaticum]|nr:Abcc1 [Symbiodinium microadriaticum]